MQRRSGIRTRQLWHHWIDEVIGRVALESARLDEPLIVSLCADDAGLVAEGYAVAVRAVTGERPETPNAHAAKERLECYRYFEAVGLPADGGSVAPATTVSAHKAATKAGAVAHPGGQATDEAGRPSPGDLPHLLHGDPAVRRLRQLRLTLAVRRTARSVPAARR